MKRLKKIAVLVFLAVAGVLIFQGCGTSGSHYMGHKGCQATKIGNHAW